MKIFIVYIVILLAMFGVVIGLVRNGHQPDRHIVGTWKETARHFEKSDIANDQQVVSSLIDHETHREISKDLVVHEAELWTFNSDGKAVLVNSNGEKKHLDYDVKDRGQILKLQGLDSGAEHYQIKGISSGKMEIHFRADKEVRGVVKMILEKVPGKLS